MSDVLQAEQRDKIGKLHNRRLRADGKIPAVLYGHGEGSVSLTLSKDQLRGVLRHGGKLVELKGAASGQALLQDMQWDAFGRDLLHVDLLRVHAGDRVTVEIPVDTKGEAPGEREGGIVEMVLHEITIEVSPASLPERLHIDISELNLNESAGVEKILDLPEGAEVKLEENAVIVHCVPPAGEPEEADAVAAPSGEPEIVGKSADSDEAEES